MQLNSVQLKQLHDSMLQMGEELQQINDTIEKINRIMEEWIQNERREEREWLGCLNSDLKSPKRGS